MTYIWKISECTKSHNCHIYFILISHVFHIFGPGIRSRAQKHEQRLKYIWNNITPKRLMRWMMKEWGTLREPAFYWFYSVIRTELIAIVHVVFLGHWVPIDPWRNQWTSRKLTTPLSSIIVNEAFVCMTAFLTRGTGCQLRFYGIKPG